MYRYIFLLLLLLSVGNATLMAQPGGRFARIKEAKEAHLTEYLGLTEAEAAAFLPVYWSYDLKLRQLKRTHRVTMTESPAITETAALESIRARQRARQEYLDLETAAETAYLKQLPATKVVLLEEAERSFQRKLVSRIRDNRPRNH